MGLKHISNAYQLTVQNICTDLESDPAKGLSVQEAVRRLTIFGQNRLADSKRKSLFKLLVEQFLSPLAWVLMIAASLAFAFQEWLEGTAVIIVIVINALIGLYMEWQANRSMEALRQLAQTKTSVIRDGRLQRINTAQLVPGDLVFLEAGDVVPADCRIIEEMNLGVKEAALTGESTQVSKQTEALSGEVVLAERSNLIFKGTVVSRGNVRALVTATGKATELGKIARMTDEAVKKITPLDKKLNQLSQKLILLTIILATLIVVIGLIQQRDLYTMVKTAIALAIATIPEGLPIVATIALARGMLRLARQKVIVKKLSAVETLGETEVIFTDKTGTLTENKLSVDTVTFAFGSANVFFKDNKLQFYEAKDQSLSQTYAFELIQKIGALCNNAFIGNPATQGGAVGDPLEIALLQFAKSDRANVEELRKTYPRLKEIPFDSDTKMMGTLHKNGKRPDYLVCIKGALEVVLDESDYILMADGRKPLTEPERRVWEQKAGELAKTGLRVLAFAYSEIDQPKDRFFHNLTFVGFLGFLDPPRPEIKEALQTCRSAGIKVIMVTGDHPETAKNIAFKTGLVEKENARVLSGKDLKPDFLKNSEHQEEILNTNIFARVSPAQKLDLVSIYQERGKVVGMTGDGINDTPALKKADIGIAMGARGTEAAKEAADLVLENDAFSSIVMAIRQGRGIFKNIRFFVVYLLSCNLSELLVVTLAFFSSAAIPLLPLQILFLNMVTDVFPALALGMNKEAADVMKEKPRKSNEPVISRQMWVSIITYAIAISASVLGLLYYVINYLEVDAQTANNLTFYTLILAQLWHVFNLPEITQSFFSNPITKNRWVWYAILLCIAITVATYLQPTLQEVLHLKDITWTALWVVIPFSLLPLVLVQILKRLRIIV